MQYKTAHLIDVLYVFWLFHWPAVPPSLSLSSGLPVLCDTITLKLSQLITLQCFPGGLVVKNPPANAGDMH